MANEDRRWTKQPYLIQFTGRFMTIKHTIACLFGLLLGAATAGAATEADIAAEIAGHDLTEPRRLPVPDPSARAIALRQLPAGGLLLIPESSNDRVMAFDPVTGDLIDPDFIAADPTNLSTPIHAILAADGQSLLVSDQIADVVQQYALNGTYLGVFAPAGGADTSILDNIRGISLDPDNGHLLVSVGGGANADSIAEFDTAGNYLGNRVANGAGGLDSPFDVLVFDGALWVGGITSDAIHRYQPDGTSLGVFASVDSFPEQLAATPSGNLLVGNFSGIDEGVIEFSPAGSVIGIYDPASVGGYRGVYELPNGNILTTNGDGVHEIDRSGNLIETKISGVSARFIEFVQEASGPTSIPIPTLDPWMLAVLALMLALVGGRSLRRRHR